MNGALLGALMALSLAPVELRSGQVIDAPLESIGPAGVTLGGLQSRTLSWDRIARVTGSMETEARDFATFADDAWRARLRLARGDVALAAPIFERLYASGTDLEGPTGLLIAEGTMRCRIENDPRGATDAWLRALALRSSGVKLDGEPVAAGFTDQVTGLVPSLPPIFVVSDGGGVALPSGDEQRTRAYAELYAIAQGADAGEVLLRSSNDAAIEFVRLIVVAQRASETERAAARRVLENQRRTSDDDWRDAWRLGAIGRSLAMSEDESERMQGVFTLLEVVASWGEAQAHLSAVALHDAANALDALGRNEEAERLRDELVRSYPDHPAALAAIAIEEEAGTP